MFKIAKRSLEICKLLFVKVFYFFRTLLFFLFEIMYIWGRKIIEINKK